MPPTLINPNASNWVDRGEAPRATIERVIARFLDRNVAQDAEWFKLQSDTLLGMVAADATEVHVAGYLRTLLPEDLERDSSDIRVVAIAVWHIAKAALVRDFAERVLQRDVPPNEPTPESLSHWLAARLLTAEQLNELEAESGDGSRD